ncbi:flavoprotein [Streptosporangium sp. CA-135522]|uniref:flavoprotein n=1 Tax=Streptosporangium sp. CA-135522 TaxID=3240072 RepID=UPI003D941764
MTFPSDPSEPRQLRLLLGVCGSVSSLTVPHLLAWLSLKLGVADVRVVLTTMARRFVTEESLRAVAACETFSGWDDLPPGRDSHVTMANWAEVIAVLPATANFLGKVANGIADDLLTSILLAASCPVVLVPAMSEAMWDKPSVRRNVARLRDDGYQVVEPGNGVAFATGEAESGSFGDFRRPLVTAVAQALANRGRTPSEQGAESC